MSFGSTDSINIIKRRLMLYKAVQEFPDNQRIRNALIRTYARQYIQAAAESGVYIAYARNDELFALELATALRQVEVNVWLDQIDVEPHEDWKYAVRTALSRSGVMVLVLSPAAIDDDDLRSEAITFMEAGKIVIPVIHETCQTDLLQTLIPPIDFSDDFDFGLRLLLQSIAGSSPVNA